MNVLWQSCNSLAFFLSNNTVLTVFELTHHLRPLCRSVGFFHWARNPTRPQRSPHSKLCPCCASPPRPWWQRTTSSSPAAPKSSPCSHGHSAACRTCVLGGFWSESDKWRDSEPVCCTPESARRQNSWPIHVGEQQRSDRLFLVSHCGLTAGIISSRPGLLWGNDWHCLRGN